MSDNSPETERWLREQCDALYNRPTVDRVIELIGERGRAIDLLLRCAASGVDPVPLAERYRESLDGGGPSGI